jgi:translation initiation factor 2 alpha subunit (eIF-2alpha)
MWQFGIALVTSLAGAITAIWAALTSWLRGRQTVRIKVQTQSGQEFEVVAEAKNKKDIEKIVEDLTRALEPYRQDGGVGGANPEQVS